MLAIYTVTIQIASNMICILLTLEFLGSKRVTACLIHLLISMQLLVYNVATCVLCVGTSHSYHLGTL